MSYSSNRHHFRSGTGSSTSSQTEVRTSRRQAAVIDVEDRREAHRSEYELRRDDQYVDEQELENRRRRSPTPSHYETELDQPEYRFLLASDVRRQVRQAPSYQNATRDYPHEYLNYERLPVRSQAPRNEHPIVPSPEEGREAGNWRPGRRPGPVRAIYNEDDRTVFDVGYHDDDAAPTGPRAGSGYLSSPFKLAKYRPGLDYMDRNKKRRS